MEGVEAGNNRKILKNTEMRQQLQFPLLYCQKGSNAIGAGSSCKYIRKVGLLLTTEYSPIARKKKFKWPSFY